MALSDKDRCLIRLSTAIVLGEWDEVRRLRRAAKPPEPDQAWRECVLQVHLFAGFPRVVQAFGVLDEVGGLGVAATDEVEGDATTEMQERGLELFESIYGSGSDRVRDLLNSHHADFGQWILEHAYGRVLARPGLSGSRRELLASCALAALGQDRQLASHARGALRLGADFDELGEALAAVGDLLGSAGLERALRIASAFRDAPDSERS